MDAKNWVVSSPWLIISACPWRHYVCGYEETVALLPTYSLNAWTCLSMTGPSHAAEPSSLYRPHLSIRLGFIR